MVKNRQYSEEICQKFGKNMAKRLIKVLESDKFKEYIFSEVLEDLKQGEEVYDDLGEIVKKIFIDYLIEECEIENGKKE